jgi:hypothetical protein
MDLKTVDLTTTKESTSVTSMTTSLTDSRSIRESVKAPLDKCLKPGTTSARSSWLSRFYGTKRDSISKV